MLDPDEIVGRMRRLWARDDGLDVDVGIARTMAQVKMDTWRQVSLGRHDRPRMWVRVLKRFRRSSYAVREAMAELRMAASAMPSREFGLSLSLGDSPVGLPSGKVGELVLGLVDEGEQGGERAWSRVGGDGVFSVYDLAFSIPEQGIGHILEGDVFAWHLPVDDDL